MQEKLKINYDVTIRTQQTQFRVPEHKSSIYSTWVDNFDKSNESMTYHFEASNSSLLVSFSLGLLSSFLVCT